MQMQDVIPTVLPLQGTLAATLPGLRAPVLDGSLSLPDAVTLCQDLVSREWPQAAAALLAGSIAQGTYRPYSDLDLYVLLPPLAAPSLHNIIHDGVPVEVHLHGKASLVDTIRNEAAQGFAVALQALATGIPVLDRGGLAALQADARQRLAQPAPTLAGPAVTRFRASVTNALLDLCSGLSHAEMIGCGARLHDMLAMVALRGAGHWGATGRQATGALRRLDPALADHFHHAFLALFTSGDAKPVLRLAEQVMQPLGGFVWANNMADAPLVV